MNDLARPSRQTQRAARALQKRTGMPYTAALRHTLGRTNPDGLLTPVRHTNVLGRYRSHVTSPAGRRVLPVCDICDRRIQVDNGEWWSLVRLPDRGWDNDSGIVCGRCFSSVFAGWDWVTLTDADTVFLAAVPPERWNGFLLPRFDQAEADRLARWITDDPDFETQFTWEGDVLVHDELDMDVADGSQAAWVEVERLEPGPDGRYAVGGWRWTWQPASSSSASTGVNA